MSFDLKKGPVFTAFASWPDGTDEEIDVQVTELVPLRLARAKAREKAEALLADPDEYKPGGKVVRVESFRGVLF